jgi:hypothetical protein
MAANPKSDPKTEKPPAEGEGLVLGYPADHWENDASDVDAESRYSPADRAKGRQLADELRKAAELRRKQQAQK